MIISIITTYIFGILIDKYKKQSKLFLIISIIAMLNIRIEHTKEKKQIKNKMIKWYNDSLCYLLNSL